MANAGTVRFPVQMEISNLQDIVNRLKSALTGVKVDTKEYKELNTLLEKANKELTKMQYTAEKGVIDKSSLKQFGRSTESVMDNLELVAKKLRDINFDNLVLTPAQQQAFNDLQKKVDDVKKSYNDIQSDKIEELAKNSADLANTFKDAKIDFKTDNIESSLGKVNNKIDETTKKIEDLTKKQTKIQTNLDYNNDLVLGLNRAESLFKADASERATNFSEYFNKAGNFKAGGKEALNKWLSSLGLDPNTLDEVKKLSASKISTLYDEIAKQADASRKKILSEQKSGRKELNLVATQIASEQTTAMNLGNAKSALEGLNVDPAIVTAYNQMVAEVAHLNQEVEKLRENTVQASAAHVEGAKAVEDGAKVHEKLREEVEGANASFEKMDKVTANINNLQNLIGKWMGFYQVINLVKNGIKNIISDIRNLDKVITEIAIVTNMTQEQLWNQMNTYQAIAKQYGVSTQGVYTISQLYYQQGLDSVSVMKLTTETLKMAKIAGLDYSTATDYMTVAIRAFKIELEDTHKIVDVYSNLASKSASSTEELAVAMSKTASSAAAVGSSFENTTAMMAVMIETTRESATNIGSAMKSIISRYGEMTSDPTKLVDEEGEALSLNKVDKALQTVGISIHDAAGQFRDFDDVILELSQRWSTIDSNTQRYIATVMAIS